MRRAERRKRPGDVNVTRLGSPGLRSVRCYNPVTFAGFDSAKMILANSKNRKKLLAIEDNMS